jgi:ribosomal-protein-alanine N-acetyltransferase
MESYRLPEEFQTPHYRLRRVTIEDAEAIFAAYAADPQVTRYLGWKTHRDLQQTRDFLGHAAALWDRGTDFPVVAYAHEAPQKLLGMFHPRRVGQAISYGYVLRASAWGQGCASEILRALIEHALSHPGIYRTEAFCDVENRASARVMEKAGMRYEGRLLRYFIHPNIADAPRDCLIYSRTR